MRLRSITIEGYRCFDRVTIPFASDLATFFGENNVGKSTVGNALMRAVEGLVSTVTAGPLDFPYGRQGPIHIEATIDFSQTEMSEIIQTLVPPGRSDVIRSWLEGQGSAVTISMHLPANPGQPSSQVEWGELFAWNQRLATNLTLLPGGSTTDWDSILNNEQNFKEILMNHSIPVGVNSIVYELLRKKIKFLPDFRVPSTHSRSGSMESWTGGDTSGVLFNLKMHHEPRQQDRYHEIISKLRQLFPQYLRIDVVDQGPGQNAPEVYFYTRLPNDLSPSGERVTLRQVSAGVNQALTLLTNIIGRRGEDLILFIEHPELHLHPLGVRFLYHELEEAAQEHQVIVITHDPSCLGIKRLEGFTLFRRAHGMTTVARRSAADLAEYCAIHGAPAKSENVVSFYEAAATNEILAGFFARRIVLVEGPTESLAFPTLLQRVNLDVTGEGIAIISVQGIGNLAKWWRFFTAYGIPVYVIFDNDATASEEDLRAKKAARQDLFNTLHITQEKVQNLVENDEWPIQERFAVFRQDFEKAMRVLFDPRYSFAEAEAAEKMGLSARQAKPLIARYAASHIVVDDHQPGWAKLRELVKRIQGVESPSA